MRVLQPSVRETFVATIDIIKEKLYDLGFSFSEERPSMFMANLQYGEMREEDIEKFASLFSASEEEKKDIEFFLTETVKEILVDTASEIFDFDTSLPINKIWNIIHLDNDIRDKVYDRLPDSCIIIEVGYGVVQEQKYSTPSGIGLRLSIYDDEAIRMPSYTLGNEEIKPKRLGGLANGYMFLKSADTDENYPEDVDIDDATSTCEYFLKKVFPNESQKELQEELANKVNKHSPKLS